jgi:hypothetical protein
MQKIIIYLLPLLLAFPGGTQAQLGIGVKHRPDPSAMLDMNVPVTGKYQGVLLPRIPIASATDRSSIQDPDDYLLVFSPYTANSSRAGLNYWYNGRWNTFFNHAELYDSISGRRIAQFVMFATQSNPETTSHVTDPQNKSPYKLPVDHVDFDSQNGFDKAGFVYVIQEPGLYEIVCNAEMTDLPAAVTMQIFIQINGATAVNDMVTDAPSTVSGSVFYIAELKKGDQVYGAVGVGSWINAKYRVAKSSLAIVKY